MRLLATLLVFCSIVAILISSSVERKYPASFPLLVPPFYGIDLESGVTGDVAFKLKFDGGKIDTVSIVSSNLRPKVNAKHKAPDLIKVLVEKLTAYTKGFQSTTVSPFAENLTIEYTVDPLLKKDSRRYEIEYGDHDLPVKIRIAGPLL